VDLFEVGNSARTRIGREGGEEKEEVREQRASLLRLRLVNGLLVHAP
jgi:hypothetical protein